MNSQTVNRESLPTSFIGELILFGYKQALACIFGATLLLALLLTRGYSEISGIDRNDFLFLFAVSFQLILILSRMEHLREVAVILVFHILATIMEWFKTSPEIGSWHYPSEGAIFRIYQVPLFAGFLYSSVGSYIARAWRIFDFTFTHYPPMGLTMGLSVLAYLNFFTHHYVWDCRWILIGFSILLFARCQIHFTIVKTRRRMPLLVGLLAVTIAIWFAENIGTYARAWAYPNQEVQWQLVHPGKITAWYLLMLFSFVLVTLIQPGRCHHQTCRSKDLPG